MKACLDNEFNMMPVRWQHPDYNREIDIRIVQAVESRSENRVGHKVFPHS